MFRVITVGKLLLLFLREVTKVTGNPKPTKQCQQQQKIFNIKEKILFWRCYLERVNTLIKWRNDYLWIYDYLLVFVCLVL